MLEEHLGYVTDRTRVQKYSQAIALTIKPGDIVADIGAGVGVLGALCLRAGASRVVAVESTGLVQAARETLRRATGGQESYAVKGLSQQVELGERVDVIVCDHVGYFGFDYGIVDLLRDARRRFLKPGGRIIPAEMNLFVAPVQSQRLHDLARAWSAEDVPIELRWLAEYGMNFKYGADIPPTELIGPPAQIGVVDFTADTPEFFRWQAELRAERDGYLHGLAGWFSCTLASGIMMSNSPFEHDAIRRSQAYLPLQSAVAVRKGDVIDVLIMARPTDHLLTWRVSHRRSGHRAQQSTWHASLCEPDSLLRSSPEHVPRLTREGRARAIILGYCDGTRSRAEIESIVLKKHRDLFPTEREISSFVSRVLDRDSD